MPSTTAPIRPTSATRAWRSGSWLSIDATSTVQNWVSGAQTNYGFALYQKEDGSQGAAYLSKFYSADNGSSIPKLVVNYDPGPTAAVTVDSSVHTWGDTATIPVKANTYYYADVKWLETGLNLKTDSSDPTQWRGVIGWFRTASLVPSSRWTTDGTFPNGSVIAHYSDSANPTDYGANTISVSFGGCSNGYTPGTGSAPGYQRATFSIMIGQNFGSLTAVSPDTRFGMGPSGGKHRHLGLGLQPLG